MRNISLGMLLLIVSGAGAQTTTIDNFESYAVNAAVMFRAPTYSGSTDGVDVTKTIIGAVSILGAYSGTQSYELQWTWGPPAGTVQRVRLTTFNVAVKGNPVIDTTTGLYFYVKNLSDVEFRIAFTTRETTAAPTKAIGEDGGTATSGNLLFVGMEGGLGGLPEKIVEVSNDWQVVEFDIPNEVKSHFAAGDANDLELEPKVVLESLWFTPLERPSADTVHILIDDITNGPLGLPSSTDDWSIYK